MSNLNGKYILVTGAARRIGAEIARNLAEVGANVIIHYNRSESEAKELAKALAAQGTDSFTVHADFTVPDAAKNLIDAIIQHTGNRLDGIVNSASNYAETGSKTSADCEKIHVTVPQAIIEKFSSLSHPNGASIVNILDTRITSEDPKHAEYLEAKRRLSVLTIALAKKLAPSIRVNAVAPGAVLQEQGRPESDLNYLANFNPLKTHGNPTGVASCVRFLMETEFITGQIIYYDGGYHLRHMA